MSIPSCKTIFWDISIFLLQKRLSNGLHYYFCDRKREADEELAKLNKRRAERERELELREEEQTRIQRDAELAAMGD
ncbi:hypothetical protein [Parasitella parasitica]|uniref:Uncharacterized protein n=1 Tax=Parasitella parasitica TaxID=35722 RepID=A0A0B7MSN6_9FUNG|nr:hypothetical protein [Parasitella parasitica]